MSAPKVRGNYEQLQQISAKFKAEGNRASDVERAIKRDVEKLRGGDWIGKGATRFYQEMDSDVLPALKRLIEAMGEADRVTLQIKQIIQQAEADAAKILDKEPGDEGKSKPPVIAQAAGDEKGIFEKLWDSLPGPVKDILEGAIAGDFSDRTTALGVIAQIVVGLIPYAGQVADIRDIIANGKDLYDGKDGAGLGLTIAIVAIVPGLDALKVLKPVLKAVPPKAAKELLQEIVSNPKVIKNVGEAVVTLVKNPSVIETLAKHPDAIVPVLKGGDEWAQAVTRHPEVLSKIIGENSADASRILSQPGAKFEDFARDVANKFEAADGGHSIARHGPDLTDAQLENRLRTGMAPDGKFSPAPASTRFSSYEDFLVTRDAAIRKIEVDNAVDLSKPPLPGQDTTYKVNMNHGRAIDEGFQGVPPKVPVAKPGGGTQNSGYSNVQPIDGVTNTQTTVVWNASSGRWDIVQHFPIGVKWDQATQQYLP